MLVARGVHRAMNVYRIHIDHVGIVGSGGKLMIFGQSAFADIFD